ncbi:TlpA family protein disulfide reductase [Corynebacterium anserum]|uniref:Redoxin domain-containing protein n=1 Tax=Corynebacterium anserum TaxID=2684406 RepID=A0A7G7YQE0_9CORY|nr:TlpA disulfide reductase family protein [Corynebacterium anserum]MBC2682396.1 redoxin domain-containing protein [Corynebacterium anserum]QNH96710.1 redoxin domain-containing protein [Corynebacterium anserum]
MATMPTDHDRTRIVIVTLTVIIGLAVAVVPIVASVFSDPAPVTRSSGSTESPEITADATSADQQLNSTHAVDCPEPANKATAASTLSKDAELANVHLPCLTNGGKQSRVSLAEQWAGKPTVVNVWAWWCAPCRAELPIVQQLAQNNPQWNVVGVHLDPKGQAGIDLLQELGATHLASYQDSQHVFDSATSIPKVVPVTIVYRPDGTRAELFARTFDNVQEMQHLIATSLGD